MIQLYKFTAQRPNRATVTCDIGLVRNQNMDKAPDAICGLVSFDLPLLQHLPGVSQTCIDHGVQNFILGLEVIVKIAARNPQHIRYVRKRGVRVASSIKQLIGSLNDVIASCRLDHNNTSSVNRDAKNRQLEYSLRQNEYTSWLRCRHRTSRPEKSRTAILHN